MSAKRKQIHFCGARGAPFGRKRENLPLGVSGAFLWPQMRRRDEYPCLGVSGAFFEATTLISFSFCCSAALGCKNVINLLLGCFWCFFF